MAAVWGPKADGTNGAMTEEEIVTFLYDKAPWRKEDKITKGFTKAANYMLNHKGRDGGTIYHFDGKMVFHDTENKGEITIFFTNHGSANVASIVGIGEHSGPDNKTATYTLVWKSKSWKPTKMFQGKLVPTNQIDL
jgi:hypothetical protein